MVCFTLPICKAERMAQIQMPNWVRQERPPLLDQIDAFDFRATLPDGARLSGTIASTRAHIAYAHARLDGINYMIACLGALGHK